MTLLDAARASSLATIPDGPEKDAGLALGDAVAARLVASRATDNWLAPNPPYVPGTGPGEYQLTPPGYAAPINAGAASWVPFAMTSAGQFRSNGPPPLRSRRYARNVEEVAMLGAVDSIVRTPEQTQIAKWHVEQGQFSLNRIARTEAQANGLDLLETARLFALLNLALTDGVLSVFEAKYHYRSWRPVTAIRAADTDGNPETDADPDWLPLLTTPPHPEYPAAHAVVTGAGLEALKAVFGRDYGFTATSATVPPRPVVAGRARGLLQPCHQVQVAHRAEVAVGVRGAVRSHEKPVVAGDGARRAAAHPRPGPRLPGRDLDPLDEGRRLVVARHEELAAVGREAERDVLLAQARDLRRLASGQGIEGRDPVGAGRHYAGAVGRDRAADLQELDADRCHGARRPSAHVLDVDAPLALALAPAEHDPAPRRVPHGPPVLGERPRLEHARFPRARGNDDELRRRRAGQEGQGEPPVGRQRLAVETGYLLGPAFTVRFIGSWQKAHGGWRVPIDFPPLTSPQFQVHDQLNRTDYLRLGGGVSYSLTGSVDVNVYGYGTVWGRNDVNMRAFGASLTWSASPAQLIKKRRGQEPQQ